MDFFWDRHSLIHYLINSNMSFSALCEQVAARGPCTALAAHTPLMSKAFAATTTLCAVDPGGRRTTPGLKKSRQERCRRCHYGKLLCCRLCYPRPSTLAAVTKEVTMGGGRPAPEPRHLQLVDPSLPPLTRR